MQHPTPIHIPKMGFRYCWKYITSLAEPTSVLIEVIDVETVIAVNMDSNFYMSLIHFNVHRKGVLQNNTLYMVIEISFFLAGMYQI